MPDDEPNVIQVIFTGLFGNGNSSAVTSRENEIILKKVNMHILEMEDVLFHLNSAVMMPENPEGKNSEHGGGASAEQSRVSGIKALGLVFKQFEFDSEDKMVISGHTDRSDTDEFNFKLSKERALNILYLLYKDEKDESKKNWADVCYNRQKVEDYQQILTYFEKKLACGCDPDGIDGKWGDKTKKATQNFLTKMGLNDVKTKAAVYEIGGDQKHRWPAYVWEIVYDLYSKELAEALEISLPELEARRKSSVRFVDDDKKIVACGESFPIDPDLKTNYYSQKDRRVEIVFFDNDEIPELNCPAQIKKAHTQDECPLWRKFYFVPLYIDPADLKAIVYHIKFMYYDKIHKKLMPAPSGLLIKAYEDNHKQIPTETIYKKGVYFVKVKFKDKIKDPARTQFYFEYETTDKWIYAKDDKTDPVMVTKTADQIKQMSYMERQNYYDLPRFWSSRNYWTRYGGDFTKGERFEKVFFDNTFADSLKLKPFGEEITKKDKPLVFSMDDIVLVTSANSQIINDKNSSDNHIPLDDNSRYTLFYIDNKTKEDVKGVQKIMMRMKIHNPETDQPVFTSVEFKENLITDVPANSRVVSFANGFYDITTKRTSSGDTSFDYAKKHIAGCRTAKLNDTDVHHWQDFETTRDSDKTNGYGYNGTFHFELHYFHDCAVLDNKPLQYLFIYWSCRLKKNAAKGGTDADVTNHRKSGMTNAMARLNKEYMYEKSSGTKDYFIRPFHFMEAKNNTNGGKEKHNVSITDNNNGSWNSSATASYRAACYQPEPGGWGGGDTASDAIKDSDGKAYIPLANHHEMGHATGCFDDYLYSLKINNDSGHLRSAFVPRFAPQHIEGGPYSCDLIARMKSNRSSRLRNYWKYIVWLHDMGKPDAPLKNLLSGTRFRIRYPGKKGAVNFDHLFELKDEYKNISKPVYPQANESAEVELVYSRRRAKVDLLLYKLADDQLAHFKNPAKQQLGYETTQFYHGLLPVRIKYAIKFTDDGWTFNDRKRWMQHLDEETNKMLNGKLFIETNHADFAKIYVFFVPHFEEYTDNASPDAHIKVEVKWSSGVFFNLIDFYRTSSGSGIKVTVNRGANGVENPNQIKRVIRCSLANKYGSSDTGNLTKDDFPSIVSWVNLKLGNVNAEMRTIPN